jgi:hypothetical protein
MLLCRSLLAGPSSEPREESSGIASELTEQQFNDLMLFGMRAMGLRVGIEDIRNTPGYAEVAEMVATGLNLKGLLCAELIEIRPLRLESKYEATCIAYEGGSAKKSYVIDALNGVAFEQ